jgi:hypothetical protein
VRRLALVADQLGVLVPMQAVLRAYDGGASDDKQRSMILLGLTWVVNALREGLRQANLVRVPLRLLHGVARKTGAA